MANKYLIILFRSYKLQVMIEDTTIQVKIKTFGTYRRENKKKKYKNKRTYRVLQLNHFRRRKNIFEDHDMTINIFYRFCQRTAIMVVLSLTLFHTKKVKWRRKKVNLEKKKKATVHTVSDLYFSPQRLCSARHCMYHAFHQVAVEDSRLASPTIQLFPQKHVQELYGYQ